MPRSKTRALAKQAQAVQLYTRGCTFQEIANKVGFANRGTVHRVVNKALKQQIVDDIEWHRAVKGEELRLLLRPCWDIINSESASVTEKIRALEIAVKIQVELIKLQGLDCHECDMSWRILVRGGATQERQHDAVEPPLGHKKSPEAGGPDRRSGPPAIAGGA